MQAAALRYRRQIPGGVTDETELPGEELVTTSDDWELSPENKEEAGLQEGDDAPKTESLEAENEKREAAATEEEESVPDLEAVGLAADRDEDDVWREENADLINADGAGSASSPVPLTFGQPVSQNHQGVDRFNDYYSFTVKEKGYITLSFEKTTGSYSNSLAASIYAGSVSDTNRIYYWHGMMDVSKGEVQMGRLGLRPGTYIIYLNSVITGSTVGYAYNLNVSFAADAHWEEEQDSVFSPKAVTDIGTKYYGAFNDGDKADYYSFEIKSKCKVNLYFNSKQSGTVQIFSDDGFTESVNEKLNGQGEGKDANIFSAELAAGKYYLMIEYSLSGNCEYSFLIKASGAAAGKSKYPATGTATLNGESVSSLAEAFSKMTNASADYVVELSSDMGSSDKAYEKNLVIPKSANSVTIRGNGHTVTIVGTKLTANANCTLENVSIKTMNAKGVDAALSISAKKDLNIRAGVSFSTGKTKTIACSAILSLGGELDVNKLTTASLVMDSPAVLYVGNKALVTVKNKLSGKSGAKIKLSEGFKPLAIKGEIDDGSSFTLSYTDAEGNASTLKDATQICTVNKKLTNDALACFDVSALGAETSAASYALAKPAATKAALYPLAFSYHGKDYALWKDVIGDAAALAATDTLDVQLNSDAYCYGALKLPKAGKYASITIDGRGHTLSFTGNVKLTAPMTLKDITLHGKTAKNVDKVYKITEVPKKFYTLTQERVTAGNIILPAVQ